MLPEILQVIREDLPKNDHNAWLISKPDLTDFETKITLDYTPYSEQERSERMHGYTIFADALKDTGIPGLGLGYGSTFFSSPGRSSQDLDGKLIIDPNDLQKTLVVLGKFGFEGANFITPILQEQFRDGNIDAFRLRGIVPESSRQTPFDLELYNMDSLRAFLNDGKYLVRMGLMTHELYTKLHPTITDHTLVVLLNGRKVKYPLHRWHELKDDCVWLFDVKPVGNIVVNTLEDIVFGINSVQNTLMESFPYYLEGDKASALTHDIRHMFSKFIFQFILQNDLYKQTNLEIATRFTELFVRRPRFSRDYYQIMLSRVLSMTSAVRHSNQIVEISTLSSVDLTPIGSGFHSHVYLNDSEDNSREKTVVKIFPNNESLSESEAVQFVAAIQCYRNMVSHYINMPRIQGIKYLHDASGYKIKLTEDCVGVLNLAQEIQNGLPVCEVKTIFRNLLNIIRRIQDESEENLLNPMIELKPENLVSNSQGELVFVDEFPPRFLEPWTQSLWPTYGNQSLEWRQRKAVVHGDLHHILRYLLLSFTVIRNDLDPHQFLEEIQNTFNWTQTETEQFMELVSNSNDSVSPRRKQQAANRGQEFCNYFGIHPNDDIK